MRTVDDVLEGRGQFAVRGTRTWKRRPNFSGQCERCGKAFSRYQRPSQGVPRFCSKRCATGATGSNPAVIAKRTRRGADHHGWKGNGAKPRSGRSRALRLFPSIGPCEACGAPKAERHHRDENPLNNSPSNIAVLCRKCHSAKHIDLLRRLAHKALSLARAARWRRK